RLGLWRGSGVRDPVGSRGDRGGPDRRGFIVLRETHMQAVPGFRLGIFLDGGVVLRTAHGVSSRVRRVRSLASSSSKRRETKYQPGAGKKQAFTMISKLRGTRRSGGWASHFWYV